LYGAIGVLGVGLGVDERLARLPVEAHLEDVIGGEPVAFLLVRIVATPWIQAGVGTEGGSDGVDGGLVDGAGREPDGVAVEDAAEHPLVDDLTNLEAAGVE